MGIVQAAMEQPRAFGLGVVTAAVLIAAGFLLATLGMRDTAATHDASGNIHACVSFYTGQARIMLPGRAPNCNAGEMLVELGSGGAAVDVEARVSALEAQVPDCLSDVAGDAVFSGCNVQVNNGLSTTDTQNGTGNLIVGYNENSETYARTGSHNIVVGANHGYSSYGGFVAGIQNQITGIYASVSGGARNTASGFFSSVSGGFGNTASGTESSVSGGQNNLASGASSSVSGGFVNTASGDASSVSGGSGNTASGTYSSVSGGNGRTAANTDDWVAGALFQDS